MLSAENKIFDVVIIGAGMAGMSCAHELDKNNVDVCIMEGSDGVGGRVRSDVTDEGFILDRGFQIFLQGYEETKVLLNYDELDLCDFYAGANVRFQGSFHKVADPLRHPIDGVASLANPIGSVVDKILVGLLRLSSYLTPTKDIFLKEETSTMMKLNNYGFSKDMINRFFRPFLGGIFFDNELRTSSRMLEFIMKTLAAGSNSLPRLGMVQVPQQLVSQMSDKVQIFLNAKVEEVRMKENGFSDVILENGKRIQAKKCVIATDGNQCSKLLGPVLDASPSHAGLPVGTVCLYFDVPTEFVPSLEPILYLNGDGEGFVNNMCFPSTVSPSYAPDGHHLASVSLIGNYTEYDDKQLISLVKQELQVRWFPEAKVDQWRPLRVYRIPYAQPCQSVPSSPERDVQILAESLFVCGDHRDTASLEGACISGKRTAKTILKEI